MSSMIPTNTSTPSILNFFKRKSETPDRIPDKRIRCPACHILVGKAALNSHLDNDCRSKSSDLGCAIDVKFPPHLLHILQMCGEKSSNKNEWELSEEMSDIFSRVKGDDENGQETCRIIDDANGTFSSSDESDFADAASSLVEAVYSASSQSSAEGGGRRDRRGSEPPATPKRYDFESCAPRRFDE